VKWAAPGCSGGLRIVRYNVQHSASHAHWQDIATTRGLELAVRFPSERPLRIPAFDPFHSFVRCAEQMCAIPLQPR
jgi:hypothetical protein